MTNVLTNQNSCTDRFLCSEQQFAPVQKATHGLVKLSKQIFETLKIWNKRDQDRRYLSEMEPYLLRDLGISSLDVSKEVAKPFWVK